MIIQRAGGDEMGKLEYVKNKMRMYEELAALWAARSHEPFAHDKKVMCVYASLSYVNILCTYAWMAENMKHEGESCI